MVWAPAGSVTLAYGIGDKSADFRCFFSGTVGESVHMCTAVERLVRDQRMSMSVLGLSQLDIIEERSQYTRRRPLSP